MLADGTLSDPHGLVICDRTAPLSNHINNMGYAFLLELGHQLCTRQGPADYLCFIHSCIYSFIFENTDYLCFIHSCIYSFIFVLLLFCSFIHLSNCFPIIDAFLLELGHEVCTRQDATDDLL